ncbi:hypothetical protein N7456_003107 [Penicillium angulare]|uniref:Thioredoxin domain-containing protein n=1 Tax=Penicillium angulare TaxID=116970 RepID=A0A9W9FVI1_9EURO|nr:hypothetical protein N7456_003107 [Penicillium angulare]
MPVETIHDPGAVSQAIAESTDKPVVIHFWATWLGPVSPVLPVLQEAEEQTGQTVKVIYTDSPFIPAPHSPNDIPLTLVFKFGQEVRKAESASHEEITSLVLNAKFF